MRALPRVLPRCRSQRQRVVEGHGAGAHRPDRGHRARRDERRSLDGALPHRRAPRERDDVLLRRHAVTAAGGEAVGQSFEVVVVGGGQAGLALGYHLARQRRRFVILEAAGEPAAAWRARWDSLRLFTPTRFDSLPGLAFPGDPDSYPRRDDVVAYLTDYAQRFELPVELNSRVLAVRARHGRGFL